MTRRWFTFGGVAYAAVKPQSFDLFELGDTARGGFDTPILPGSLVKPFTALAHGAPFPKVTCKGCRPGTVHGELDIVEAIAQSCNAYFEALSMRLSHERACILSSDLGLPTPPDNVAARAGLGRDWRIAPRQLLQAYARLAQRRGGDEAVKLILEGMRQCADRGTASAIAAPRGRVLAKTGTAPCEHAKRMPGDGLAVALWPAEAPRRVVLVCEHGVPGAVAAKRLGGMFT